MYRELPEAEKGGEYKSPQSLVNQSASGNFAFPRRLFILGLIFISFAGGTARKMPS